MTTLLPPTGATLRTCLQCGREFEANVHPLRHPPQCCSQKCIGARWRANRSTEPRYCECLRNMDASRWHCSGCGRWKPSTQAQCDRCTAGLVDTDLWPAVTA